MILILLLSRLGELLLIGILLGTFGVVGCEYVRCSARKIFLGLGPTARIQILRPALCICTFLYIAL
jgi:hypothetical protein